MNIVPLFGIGTAVCVTLSGCAGLVTMPKLEGCYPVDALSVWQKAALHVGSGNPILLIDGKKFVCTCYGDGSLTGVNEQGDLGRANEKGTLGKADEKGNLDRADEKSALDKADEEGGLSKADEQGDLDRADEKGALDKADEKGSLSIADERGRAAAFSCRIVPECPGFQLIGYVQEEIKVLTPAGQKAVQARCITW